MQHSQTFCILVVQAGKSVRRIKLSGVGHGVRGLLLEQTQPVLDPFAPRQCDQLWVIWDILFPAHGLLLSGKMLPLPHHWGVTTLGKLLSPWPSLPCCSYAGVDNLQGARVEFGYSLFPRIGEFPAFVLLYPHCPHYKVEIFFPLDVITGSKDFELKCDNILLPLFCL